MNQNFEVLKLGIDSYQDLKKYLKYNTFPCCDLAPANPILWSERYETYYKILNNHLVFCKRNDEGLVTQVSFPIGEGDKKVTFDMLRSYFEAKQLPFSMYMVDENSFQQIEKWYPGMYHMRTNRDYADYLYETETLAKLAGKKLHAKRNHINRFLENYPDYEYELITSENKDECKQLADAWLLKEKEGAVFENGDFSDKEYEHNIILHALDHMEELGLKGALIRVKQKIIAFTIGEELMEDVYVIHFEKAYADIQGAYTMINREFVCRELLGKYKYVNREEDLGIPGLRHAKTSYQPIRLVEKGIVE